MLKSKRLFITLPAEIVIDSVRDAKNKTKRPEDHLHELSFIDGQG